MKDLQNDKNNKVCPVTGRRVKSKPGNWLFTVLGLSSLIWFLARVIPKPSRVAYPCMKVAAPIASTFITYLLGLFATVFAFRKAKFSFARSKYFLAVMFLIAALAAGTVTFLQPDRDVLASNPDLYTNTDPLGPNNPIGQGKGIFPGRVVWVHNPDATNEDCQSTNWGDAYFMEKNNNQKIIDGMLSGAVKSLAGKETDPEAWGAIFEYFNENHGKGAIGYTAGENIYIKINSVHVGSMNSDGSIKNGGNYGYVDTSPQAVLATLRQLVYQAGVPQENIYVGDPYRKIYKHCYDMWFNEFPDVHYTVKGTQEGRETLKYSRYRTIFYSDSGAVLTRTYDKLYTAMEEADYLINIPAYKGHRWAGVSFFAKNHFGSNTRSGAVHLHNGLILPDWNVEPRIGYGKYRVFVDLMGHELLGGKTLLYVMDGLWATAYEHDPPCKFRMPPFNDDWCSSFFVSQDPVAIESVCLDMMQAEFAEADSSVYPNRHIFVHYNGVDDYMHQAADPANWPEGFVYDPESDGTPLTSLGVHEHWNNGTDMLYSRNLGTGDGIELIKAETDLTGIQERTHFGTPVSFVLNQNYPNPFNPSTTISYELSAPAEVEMSIYNLTGQIVATLVNEYQTAGSQSVIWNGLDQNGSPAASGVYVYRLTVHNGNLTIVREKKMLLVK